MTSKRGIILASHALFLFFVACGGGDEGAPPAAQGPLGKTPDIAEADKKLGEALDTCKNDIFSSGIVQALGGGGTAIPGGGTTYNDLPSRGVSGGRSKCNNDLIVALLLWKSARKQDNTLAINDPWYRKNLFLKVKGYINQAGAQTGLPPDRQQLLAGILKNQFTSNVLGRSSLDPLQSSLLRSVLQGYSPGNVFGSAGPIQRLPPRVSFGSPTGRSFPLPGQGGQFLDLTELRRAAGYGLQIPPRP